MSVLEFIQYDFLTNMAAFDTSIAIWKEKHRFNAVRPFSAIKFLFRDTPVTSWGGVGQGTVSDLPANEWQSYLPVADHPEYPSASASFCAAHAQASRLFLGSDELGYPVPAPQGSSRIEPGITPAEDLTLVFPTWTDFAENVASVATGPVYIFYRLYQLGRLLEKQLALGRISFLTEKLKVCKPGLSVSPWYELA